MRTWLVVALVAVASSGAWAVDIGAGTATAPRPEAVRPTAQVVVFNRPIVRFRSPLLSETVQQRADTAESRILALLAAPGEHKVTTQENPGGVGVYIDGTLAFAVTPDDAERMGPVAEASLASDAARKLQQVIAEIAEARDMRRLLVSAGWAALATVIWLAALWALRRFARGTARRIYLYAERRGAQMRAAGTEFVQRERVIDLIRVCLRVVFWVIVLILTYEWLGYVLGRFPYTRPWSEGLASFLVVTFLGMLSAVAQSIPGLMVAVTIFVIAHFANSWLGSVFDGVQRGRLKFNWIDADSVRPTRRLVSIAIWLFAVAMAYPYIPGAETDAFRGLSVLLGLMFSVGASGLVGQAASGLILMYTRTYRAGEYVRVADQEGTVVHLGMFTTRVRTGMGEELTLPNSMVLGSVTKNYSRTVRGEGFIVDASVTIGYDAPWRQVHAMLIEAAKRTDDVLANPTPMVFQTALSDFYVEYRLICQAIPTEPRPRAVVISALHANIQDVFNEHGVQIMSPHYFGDPTHAKVVPPEHWYDAPAKPPEGKPRAG